MAAAGTARGRWLAALAILALLLGCHGAVPWGEPGATSAGPRRASRPPPRKANLAQIEREVLTHVNRYRKSEGLPALASDKRIAEIARGHSRAMAAGRTGFGHGGFKGRSKAIDARIPYRRVSENVARNGRSPGEVPRVVVSRWVDSRGHRKNIEGPYRLTGIGAAQGSDGSIYLTQLFVAPR